MQGSRMSKGKPVTWGAIAIAVVVAGAKVAFRQTARESQAASSSVQPQTADITAVAKPIQIVERTPDQLFSAASPAVALIDVMDKSLTRIGQGSGKEHRSTEGGIVRQFAPTGARDSRWSQEPSEK